MSYVLSVVQVEYFVRFLPPARQRVRLTQAVGHELTPVPVAELTVIGPEGEHVVSVVVGGAGLRLARVHTARFLPWPDTICISGGCPGFLP